MARPREIVSACKLDFTRNHEVEHATVARRRGRGPLSPASVAPSILIRSEASIHRDTGGGASNLPVGRLSELFFVSSFGGDV